MLFLSWIFFISVVVIMFIKEELFYWGVLCGFLIKCYYVFVGIFIFVFVFGFLYIGFLIMVIVMGFVFVIIYY